MTTPLIPITRLDNAFNTYALEAVTEQIMHGEKLRANVTKARTTWECGYEYEKMLHGDMGYTPFPKIISEICRQAVATLSASTNQVIPKAEDFQNCIISNYAKNNVLPYHKDISKTYWPSGMQEPSFYWGDVVLGVILKAEPGKNGIAGKKAATLALQAPENGQKPFYSFNKATHIPEEDGSVFILQGAARNEWYHGVTPGKGGRISLTFRPVGFK